MLFSLGASVPTHRRPSRVEYRLTFLFLVTDHGGQPAQRDVGCFVGAYVVHDQIGQHVDECADLGDTLEAPGGGCCRGLSDAHDAARNTRATKTFGRVDATRSLLFGDVYQFGMRVVFVARSCVRNPPAGAQVAFGQNLAHRDEQIVVRNDTRAMAVDIHLGPDLEYFAMFTAEYCNRFGARDAVDHDIQIATWRRSARAERACPVRYRPRRQCRECLSQ